MGRRGAHDEEGGPDEALLAAMAVGDEEAGLVFVRRYQHRLFGLARTILGDAALAEDVAQEAFIRIFRHAVVFDARRGSVSSWALTITRNLAIDALRIRRGTPVDPDDPIFLELTSSEVLPEDRALSASELPGVRRALSSLTLDQRRAVLLSAMYGRSAGEIARAEGIALGTAKSRIRLGMAKLRQVLVVEKAR